MKKCNYEEKATELYKQGNNCSNSLYYTFKEEYELSGNIPAPRSIDGICGTILTTHQILKELGKEEYINDYNQQFINEFKFMKCIDLVKYEKRCEDYIKFSADYIQKAFK